MAFAGALLERWPVMFAGLWSQVNVDLWGSLARPGQLIFSGLALVVCVLIAAVFMRTVRNEPEARFWFLGTILALVPATAAFPMNRLLLFAGVGAFGLLAILARDFGLLGGEAMDRRPWPRRAAKILIVLHGPLAVLLLIAGLFFLPVFNLLFTAGARMAPRDPELADQSLIFVNGHSFPCAYTYIIRRIEESPAPRRIAILGPMTSAATVTRESDRTLVISAEDGWFRYSIDRLMLNTDSPFVVGQRFRTADFEATIRSVTTGGRPRVVSFAFEKPLEHPSYRWVRWRQGALEEWPVPHVSESDDLSEESLLALQ
jgi:hypothetical protein